MVKKLIECLIQYEWYECPISIAVFSLFVLLFIYSIMICYHNWKQIKKYSSEILLRDQDTLHKLEKLYTVNLISCFVSFAVIVFFISRAVPLTHFMGVFNQYVAAILVLFLIIVSSWNIGVYNTEEMKTDSSNTSIQSTNGVVLGISLTVVVGTLGYMYLSQTKNN